jgi:hypothetical protein
MVYIRMGEHVKISKQVKDSSWRSWRMDGENNAISS